MPTYTAEQKMFSRWATSLAMMNARRKVISNFKKIKNLVEVEIPRAAGKGDVKKVIKDIKKEIADLHVFAKNQETLLISMIRLEASTLKEIDTLSGELKQLIANGFPAGEAKSLLAALSREISMLNTLDNRISQHYAELAKKDEAVNDELKKAA